MVLLFSYSLKWRATYHCCSVDKGQPTNPVPDTGKGTNCNVVCDAAHL
jgi:hypothetical protein